MKNYYYPTSRLTYKISELVIPDNDIKIDGYTYSKLMKRPLGRAFDRRLINPQTDEKIILLR